MALPTLPNVIASRLMSREDAVNKLTDFLLKQLKIPTLPQTPATEFRYLRETLNRSYLIFGVTVYLIGATLISSNSTQDVFLFILPAILGVGFYLFRLKERSDYEVRHPEETNWEKEFARVVTYINDVTADELHIEDSNVYDAIAYIVSENGKLRMALEEAVVDTVPLIQEVERLNRTNDDPWQS